MKRIIDKIRFRPPGPLIAGQPSVRIVTVVIAVISIVGTSSRALGRDEPGDPSAVDEPGIELPVLQVAVAAPEARLSLIRVELAFGLSSLLVDPDVGEGYGGGLHVGVRLVPRVELEVAAAVGVNPYKDLLGGAASLFLAGQVTLGSSVHLLAPEGRLNLTVDAGLGAYVLVQGFQAESWTLGFYGGATFSVKLTSWFGVGVRLRYHLFNVAQIAGPEFRDLKSFTAVGVVDRFELPAYLAFYF